MSVEIKYSYDEPIGIYGHESQERLARGVLQDLVRYDETLEPSGAFSELPELGVSTASPEEFRISSIVESNSARFGYALALAQPSESDRATMGGVFYHINREDPSIIVNKGLVVARPETFQSHRDYRDEIEGLMYRFDKGELEAIMRMIGKMTASLELSRELNQVNDDDLAALSVAGRMKQEAKIHRTRGVLKRIASVEPFVISALHNHSQNELRALFPQNQPFPERQEDSGDKEHILDWHEFVGAADGLLNTEADPSLAESHVNIHYEIGSRLYYIKLVAKYGQLSGVQVLCDNTGAWKSQMFKLGSADEDIQADINIVSPIWDKSEILASLSDGKIIDNQDYEYYRMLAENSIRDTFKRPDNLIHIKPANRKRPAA